jgi:hypothetical protein
VATSIEEEVVMSTEQVAKRLVELCRKGEYEQAQRELYADNAVSIEMEGAPSGGGMGNARGLAAILEKGRQFNAMLEAVHGGNVSEAVIAGNWFSISMTLDATMKGRGRVNMQEICVYEVRDGKIAREQFFYDVA